MTPEKILRKSFALFQKHWKFLALVALISFAINAVLSLILSSTVAEGAGGMLAAKTGSSLFTAAGLASLGFGAIVTLLIIPLLTGAGAEAARAVIDGKTGSPVGPFQKALMQYGTYLLVVVVLVIALGIGFKMFLIPGIILVVLLGLAPTIVAFERVGVSEALQKAWAIGLRHFWTILLVGVIVGVVIYVLQLVFDGAPLIASYVATLMTTFAALTLGVIYTETK